jgi:hypothetical protein
MPYQWIKILDLPSAIPAGGTPAVEFDIGSFLEFKQAVTIRQAAGANDHMGIQNLKDNKNVRIGSRNITQTSGDHSAVQIKPNQSVTGTASVTGMEVSPRFAAGIAGANLIAIKCDPLLKAGAGNLSGKVAGIEINIDFGVSGTRTITGDVSALETFLAIPSTYTYSGHVAVIRVRDVNIKGWDALFNFDSGSVGCIVVSGGTYSTADGYAIIKVGDTEYRMPFFSAVD